MEKVAGPVYLTIDGTRYTLVGDWDIEFGFPIRQAKKDVNGIVGYTEEPQIAAFRGSLQNYASLDLKALSQLTDVTAAAQLANGTTAVLREAYVNVSSMKAQSGEIEVAIEGVGPVEIVPA